MLDARIKEIFNILKKSTYGMTPPMGELIIREFGRQPFIVLAACLISLRAQDKVTYPICKLLFSKIKTPQELLNISLKDLDLILSKINFHKKKAQALHAASKYLIENTNSLVPDTYEELIKIPGVGQKTANLVLNDAFKIPAICVDTHVHKLSNRLGLVNTKTADQTEIELKKIIPKKYWSKLNYYFVMWGQNICVPISPFCSICKLAPICPKVNITKHR